eukprot:325058_1
MAFHKLLFLLSIIIVTVYSWEDIGVYFAGRQFCGINRCSCFGDQRSCCTPFGAEYGSTLTAGTVPSSGCANHFLDIQVYPDGDPQDTTSIDVKVYPDGYPQETTVFYTIHSYGKIAKSDFTNVADWTNNSPVPSYPNDLNIKVGTPQIMSSVYNGSAVIPSGSDQGTIQLNITSNRTCLVGESGSNCITYDECISNALGFGLFLTSCTTVGNYNCTPIYPYVLWMEISKSIELCEILYPQTPSPTVSPTNNNDGSNNVANLKLYGNYLCGFVVFIVALWIQHE